MARRADALKHFKRVDPHFYRATLTLHGALPAELREKHTRTKLFESLVSIVISQQVGVRAADTIFARVKEANGGRLTSLSIQEIKTETLRAAGLSSAKTKTLKAIAEAVESGALDLLKLKKISEVEAAERLMNVWGLGPWSVEMFLIFALGRPDVFSVGDLGLVRAMEAMYGLPKGVSRKHLSMLAQKWSPYRTYAALLLWRSRDTRAD
ncbi:MAG: DNA-3-methyladenine glycosylase family protein [Minisyncoccota bacterium]